MAQMVFAYVDQADPIIWSSSNRRANGVDLYMRLR
jgi:hypothetical protein